MRSIRQVLARPRTWRAMAAAAIFAAAVPMPCEAQGFGIGGRLSMVRGDVDAGTSSERFTGGQIRAGLSRRVALELALDVRTETNEALTERVRDYPLQASMLLFPVRSTFSPYVLGGVGWYSRRVQQLEAEEVLDSETTRRFGSHAGFGAEIRLGRHAGLHADYRYTFLDFGSDEEEEERRLYGVLLIRPRPQAACVTESSVLTRSSARTLGKWQSTLRCRVLTYLACQAG
jgi:opacity protein-like surface antigen